MVVVMLGRRSPQRGLFDVIGLPHTVDPESFYGRMGALAHLLRIPPHREH